MCNACICQDTQKELQGLRSSTDTMRDTLGALCRRFPSGELAQLGLALTELARQNEAAHQLCSRALGSLQDDLLQRFSGERPHPTRGLHCVSSAASILAKQDLGCQYETVAGHQPICLTVASDLTKQELLPNNGPLLVFRDWILCPSMSTCASGGELVYALCLCLHRAGPNIPELAPSTEG